eukprot:gb/GECG01016234.1/.p1 GENE.gb/GECG01016234.1/~~gb/GECG01016234.1/.p1  ORF type:complete len:1092 (+),score=88.98 gb/GECG01016234.1/:1-3276(+)
MALPSSPSIPSPLSLERRNGPLVDDHDLHNAAPAVSKLAPGSATPPRIPMRRMDEEHGAKNSEGSSSPLFGSQENGGTLHSAFEKACRKQMLNQEEAHFFARMSEDEIEQFRECLRKGITVTKMGRRGAPAKRVIQLTEQEDGIRWSSKRKSPACSTVHFAQIERVQKGQHTSVFERHKKLWGHLRKHSLSLICGPGITGGGRTLDLVFPSEEDRTIWYNGITVLTILERVLLDDCDRKALRWAFLREVHCPRPSYYLQQDESIKRRLYRRWSAGDIYDRTKHGLLRSFDCPMAKVDFKAEDRKPKSPDTWNASMRSRIYFWQFCRVMDTICLRSPLSQQKSAFYHVAKEQNSDTLELDHWTINYEGFARAVDLLKVHWIVLLIWSVLVQCQRRSCQDVKQNKDHIVQQCLDSVTEKMQNGEILENYVSETAFDRFLHRVQRQSSSESSFAKSVTERYRLLRMDHSMFPSSRRTSSCNIDAGNQALSLPALASYLFSYSNSMFSYTQCKLQKQDMARPLRDYFISSSHNTYLEGDQIAGKSSANAYIDALQHGCRSVELDCWDGPKGEPLVYHGRTLTSPISFEDVISALAAYAFTNSEFPLILSLEVHCCIPQQIKMSETLYKQFGKSLGPVFEENTSTDMADCTLTPENLRRRVLLKWKTRETQDYVANYPVLASDASRRRSEDLPQKFRARPITDSGVYESTAHSCKHCEPFATHLSRMITLKAVKFKIMVAETSLARSSLRSWHMCSVKEPKLFRYVQKEKEAVETLTRKHLVRVYPGPMRVNSSNFNPSPYWYHGVQMVALNFQTRSQATRLNQALFRLNGKTGYVLKPSTMEHPKEAGDSGEETVRIHSITTTEFLGRIIDDYVGTGLSARGIHAFASTASNTVSDIFRNQSTAPFQLRITLLGAQNLPNPSLGRQESELAPMRLRRRTFSGETQFEDSGRWRDAVSPYVKLCVYEDKEEPAVYNSSVLSSSSHSPSWIEQSDTGARNVNCFCIHLKYPDRGFLHFSVYESIHGPQLRRRNSKDLTQSRLSVKNILKSDKESRELGYCCVPMMGLVPGVRCCPLRHPETGKKIPFSSLLCYIQCV